MHLGRGRNAKGTVTSLRVPVPVVLSFLSAEPWVLTQAAVLSARVIPSPHFCRGAVDSSFRSPAVGLPLLTATTI